MRVESTKHRQPLSLFLCFLGLSVFISACSSSECASGYEEIDGECVYVAPE